MSLRQLHPVVGNIHLHTVLSDGSGSHVEVARAAAKAGLDFLITTDHNVLALEKEGWYDDVLVLVGEETNDPQPPHRSHSLHFGISQDVADLAGEPQALIDAVHAQGGFTFLAHPCEREGRFIHEPAYSWTHWDVEGYAGISIWNYMSEFKSLLTSLPAALLAVALPTARLSGPFPETLALYDRLLAVGHPVAITGASDAHANTYAAGPLRWVIFPYAHLFRTVNVHLLLERPLAHDLSVDRALIHSALRAGRCYVGYHVLGDPAGFHFEAHTLHRSVHATFGETLFTGGETLFEVQSPRPARLRLLRDGQIVAERWGRRLTYRSMESGVYRIEAYRWAWLRWRGWVFTNPIYVRPATCQRPNP